MRQVQSRHRFSSTVFVLILLSAVSSFAQTRTTWSTAADIRPGARGAMVGTVSEILANSFTLTPDRDRTGPSVRVTTDAIVTRFLGFGDANQIFAGGTGFARLRVGDRVEVRAVGDTRNTMAAEEILLLGRSVDLAAQGTGTVPNVPRGGTLEGIVRSISANENRLVIETDRREMVTVLGTSSTPVYHEGNAYRIRNIEVGDRIRVEVESSTRDGIRARLIDVIRDVTPEDDRLGSGRTVTSIRGRVTRIDTRAQTFRLEDERGRIVVIDARSALDRAGNRFRLSDLQVGDRLEVSGEPDAANNFRADTIRFDTDFDRDDRDRDDLFRDDQDAELGDYRLVTITGSLVEAWDDDTIVVRDNTGDRFRILVDREFVVRNRTGGFIRASQLREGDRLEVGAFRDRNRRYIAQTIRVR